MTGRGDMYADVTAQVLAALDAGTVPWRMPWSPAGHMNPLTNVRYRGVNPLLCELAQFNGQFERPLWATFKQIAAAGGKVRKGEHGTRLTYFRFIEKPDPDGTHTNAAGERVSRRAMLTRFVVFNVAQADGLELPDNPDSSRVHDPITACERIAAGYVGRGGPTVVHGSPQASYGPHTDTVSVPAPERFESGESYYSVLWHELAHSTGHANRLARPDLLAPNSDRKAYAREELTAEITAAMLCGQAGILPARLDQSAAYIANWRRRLADDPRCVVIAAQRAQHAADLILGPGELAA